MSIKIAIVAPGNMGAALAGRLVGNGAEVRTILEGRSRASTERAEAAGMTAVTGNVIAEVDIVLSVVPPTEVLATAKALAPALRAVERKPVYVDCNAISPETTRKVGEVVAATGADYVDGSIIGMPPREGYGGPALFVSGPAAGKVAALSAYGIDVRVMDGEVGAASALKMAYGGITKGLIAIGASMILGAQRNGIGDALHDEMSKSQAQLLDGFSRSIPDMFGKAYRWVAEMEEISSFLPPGSPESRIYTEIAAFYRDLAAEDGREGIEALAEFFGGRGDRG